MSTDATYTLVVAANTAGLVRSGDLNFSQVSSGLVDATGAVGLFLSSTGNLVNSTGLNTHAPTPQAITAAGAVSLTTRSTTIATAGAIALTLANGNAGQEKIITMITDNGDATLTPTALQGGTTLTFNDVGDTVHLIFNGTKWAIISNNGATLA